MPEMLEKKEITEIPIQDSASSSAERIGPYDLKREIGRGGMSIVYEARDTRTGQHIALKLLSVSPLLTTEEKAGLVARFEREARTLASLSHPNVVYIHEIGIYQGQHFLAMEYLQGQTLRERMTQSPLAPAEAYTILTQVAGALDAVHAAGIVHRDVKPPNVMLLPDGTAKLLDFGIARSSGEATITSAGAMIGTPSYMAPEQIKGLPATTATDLWSLGVLTYEMLAGHLPFIGQSVADVLYQITNRVPGRTPALPKAVQKVLRRALDKSPSRRYPDAAALVHALRLALPKSAISKQTPEFRAWRSVVTSAFSAPKWLQGGGLLLLFLGGFWLTAQNWHQPLSQAVNSRGQAKTPAPAALSHTPPEPDALPTPPPITRLPEPSNPPPLVRRSVALPRSTVRLPRRHMAVAAKPKRLRRVHTVRLAASPVRVRPAEVPVRQAAFVVRHRSLRSVPVRSVTLPDDGQGDSPEAEARLRKSAWSQN